VGKKGGGEGGLSSVGEFAHERTGA
jgi:hypothetical protein